MVHLKAEIPQHKQLLEKGVLIAPVALTRIAKLHGLEPAVLDPKKHGSASIISTGYVIITNSPQLDAVMRISFVGLPIPTKWRDFKNYIKDMGIHYTHPQDDDKKVILDITTKSLIVA